MHRITLLIFMAMLVVACSSTPNTSNPHTTVVINQTTLPPAFPPNTTATSTVNSRLLTVAMPYVPNVQFAPFYVAAQRGYYTRAGLAVTFDYNYETDVVQRVAQDTVQFGLASADSVLLARAQGLPVITIATNTQTFPIVLFSKTNEHIASPSDLRGKTVGIPGRFGASYIGLLALLSANDLSERDINIHEIGFTQVAALSEGKVQVGVGYATNEPLQLRGAGLQLNVLRVADYVALASDGLITHEKYIQDQPALVQTFVRATMRGMQDVLDDPDAAFTICLDVIPELKTASVVTQQLQRNVLQETLAYWESAGTKERGLGYTTYDSWQKTAAFLRGSRLLLEDVDVNTAFTNQFIRKP